MTFITCSFVSQFHPRNQKPHDGENSDLKLSLKLKIDKEIFQSFFLNQCWIFY